MDGHGTPSAGGVWEDAILRTACVDLDAPDPIDRLVEALGRYAGSRGALLDEARDVLADALGNLGVGGGGALPGSVLDDDPGEGDELVAGIAELGAGHVG